MKKYANYKCRDFFCSPRWQNYAKQQNVTREEGMRSYCCSSFVYLGQKSASKMTKTWPKVRAKAYRRLPAFFSSGMFVRRMSDRSRLFDFAVAYFVISQHHRHPLAPTLIIRHYSSTVIMHAPGNTPGRFGARRATEHNT